MARGWRTVGWLLALGIALSACGDRSASPAHPNVFLITVESLRPDHIGLYGGTNDTTPQLDAFAREAVVYEDAHAVTSWTLASHASLFTGLYPSAHGAVEPRSRLHDGALTIAEVLAANGYQTAGFASGPYLARSHRLDQGFEHYDDSTATVGTQGGAHDDVTNPSLEQVIRRFFDTSRDPSRPLFYFAYYWDPHYDYIPPTPYDEMFVPPGAQRIDVRGYESNPAIDRAMPQAELRYVVSQYEGEIRWTDEFLGRFFQLLRDRDLWDDSVVIVTADHGEEFFDHGEKGHKHDLYAESVHVPLLVKYPRSEPRGRDTRLVSLVDVFPTILALAGVHTESESQGRSLLEPAPDPDRPIFFELLSTFYHRRTDAPGFERRDERWQAVRRGDEKLVVRPGAGGVELYDVRRDPREQLDVAIERPEHVEQLRGLLADFEKASQRLRQSGADAQADLSPEHVERLRALGYIDETTPGDPSRADDAPGGPGPAEDPRTPSKPSDERR